MTGKAWSAMEGIAPSLPGGTGMWKSELQLAELREEMEAA